MRKLATAAAVGLVLGSGGAYGLGLGDIEMRSALNQPMSAEIPLMAVAAGDLEGMIVQLADANAFARAGIDRSGALTDLEFSVVDDGRPRIVISSDRPVVEPFLNFLLEVDWQQGRMVREYTVLLDPPVFMTEGTSVRDGSGDRRAVVDGEDAAIAPAPIARVADADEPADEVGDEALGADGEVGEVVSLEGLDEPSAAEGEVVPLTDLAAPNTEAAAERVAASERAFEVEILGDASEVDDATVIEAEADAAAADEGEVVPLASDAAAEIDDARDAPPSEIAVVRGDTLYEIATDNALDGVSVQQMMLALLEANRSAFINDNINLVKAGAILRVPSASEARALSQTAALAEISRQDELWRQYRDDLRRATADTELARDDGSSDDAAATEVADVADVADAAAGEDAAADQTLARAETPATEETVDGALSEEARAILESAREEVRGAREEAREELRIVVADETSSDERASATSDPAATDEQARLGEINRELQLAREELASARLQGGDLDEQVSELRSTGENLDALIALRQNEIARLESQLAEARANSSESLPAEAGDGAAITDAVDGALSQAEAGAQIAGEATAGLEESVDAAVGSVAAAGEESVDTAADVAGALAEQGEDALNAAGQALEQAEPVGAAVEDGGQAVDAGSAVVPDAAAAQPWYRALLEDPTRLAIAGAGVLGLLGVFGTLLWRRRARDDEDAFLDYDKEVEFAEVGTAEAPQSKVEAPSAPAVAAAAAAADDDEADERTAAIAAEGDDDIDKDDTISEVDVYLAYGLHGQAEELLTQAIERKPDNPEYAQKLLETYHAQGKSGAYEKLAEDYHARFGGDEAPGWAAIAERGRELRPGLALFAAGAAGVSAIGTGRLDGPALDEADFLASSGDEPVAGSVHRGFDDSAGGGDAAFDAAVDRDESALMDQSVDPAFAFDESDLEATGDFTQIAEEVAAEAEAEGSDETLDFAAANADDAGVDAGADAGADAAVIAVAGADADVSAGAGADAGTEAVGDAFDGVFDESALDEALTLDELDIADTAVAANDDAGDDSLGLGDLDEALMLDLEQLDGVSLEEGEALGKVRDEALDIPAVGGEESLLEGDETSLEDDADEMDTMMDLAKAYIDMGDKDSASSALDEIVKSGSPEQVSEAETLLRKIS